MPKRILFNSNNERALFFEKALKFFDLHTWKEFRLKLGISKAALESYRNGKLTLPEKIYLEIISRFDKETKTFLLKKISFLEEGWGRIKAGRSTYSKHREIFDVGRRKAIDFVRKRNHKFNLDLPLDARLAYFLGLFIGDGFTNKYGGYYLTQFTGDKQEEYFYKNLFSNYCKILFFITPKIREDSTCKAIRVNLYSKDLFNLLTERFKIPAGKKSHDVLIPREILDSKQEIISSFLRGLYDAEGCVFLDKRKSYKRHYSRIELHMCNLSLLKQVETLLIGLNINCALGRSEKNLRVTIWGFEEVKKFVKEIGFFNPKHLKKLRKIKG
jgi:intein/homing endonuclease